MGIEYRILKSDRRESTCAQLEFPEEIVERIRKRRENFSELLKASNPHIKVLFQKYPLRQTGTSKTVKVNKKVIEEIKKILSIFEFPEEKS